MKGRFRKAKKAYKKGEGVPLWWDGSHNKKRLQIRYYYFILLRDWEQEVALRNIKLGMMAAGSAMQLAAINSQPRPMDMSKEDFLKMKALKIAEHGIQTVQILQKAIENPIPPKPRIVDIMKPQFTT